MFERHWRSTQVHIQCMWWRFGETEMCQKRILHKTWKLMHSEICQLRKRGKELHLLGVENIPHHKVEVHGEETDTHGLPRTMYILLSHFELHTDQRCNRSKTSCCHSTEKFLARTMCTLFEKLLVETCHFDKVNSWFEPRYFESTHARIVLGLTMRWGTCSQRDNLHITKTLAHQRIVRFRTQCKKLHSNALETDRLDRTSKQSS